MDKFEIIGGKPLYGQVMISGAKNAALPIMAASILTSGTLTITNVPYLVDIISMNKLLLSLGLELEVDGYVDENNFWSKKLVMSGHNIHNFTAKYELVRQMRASIIVLGPLLARFGKALVSLPGGCAIGSRPVDLHLSALEQMGAKISIAEGYINASAPQGLHGADITFAKTSVGATENIMMAAALAQGKTILRNSAMEPEVVDLAHCLIKMGAKINGIGTSTIEIEGVNKLHSATHHIIPDRIEAATFAAIAAVTDGNITLLGVNENTFDGVNAKFHEAGVKIVANDNKFNISRANCVLNAVDIDTNPFPGFPTDAQAQFMVMMAIAQGESIISEKIFENRFMHVPELMRMGANISINGNQAIVKGVEKLCGAEVMSTDLRASVSLIIAALNSPSKTMINRIYHLDRGYDRIETKLQMIGANIRRLREI